MAFYIDLAVTLARSRGVAFGARALLEQGTSFEGKRHPSTVLSTESKNEMMRATPLGSGVQPASLAAQFQGKKSSTRFTG